MGKILHAGIGLALIILLGACRTTTPDLRPQTIALGDIDDRPWRICIDPGHGGPWPGAVAPSNGIRECDVNLAVSLHLRELLLADGHDVLLTRDTDTAIDASSLSADLRARANIANEYDADIFISVHHNADIAPNSTKNTMEMYYARRDPAASKDLGAHLLSALAQTFPEARQKLLLPGNYNVIRNTTMPAILTETAYLTDAATAKRLEDPETARAEARSIYEGITAYLSSDPPIRLTFTASNRDDGRTLLTFPRNASVDIERVQVNGVHADFLPTGNRLLLNTRLSHGEHNIQCTAVSNGSRAILTATHHVTRPLDSLSVAAHEQTSQLIPGAHTQLRVFAADQYGHGVPGLEVTIRGGDTATTNESGTAYFYIPVSTRPKTVRATALNYAARARIPSGARDGLQSLRIHLTDDPPNPIVSATIGDEVYFTDTDGWAAIPTGPTTFRSPGFSNLYMPPTPPHYEMSMAPKINAVLHHKVVLIDPLDGGRTAGAIGPTGLRSSDVSYDVAQRLAAHLRAYGARPIVLRESDAEIGELTRIARGEAESPSLYIGVTFGISTTRASLLDDEGHRIDVPERFAAHYPGSSNGMRYANAAATRLGIETVTGSVYYPIQQFSCPAILIQPADVRTREAVTDEERAHIAEQLHEAAIEYFTPVPRQ